ncbi:transposase family protein [Streptomyces xiangluensis]|uniref:Transposase family protein n=1 Tax=Streptomyces xiangluensis TaxID=2665720 RepID=A0ABV8YJ11_9ACTN
MADRLPTEITHTYREFRARRLVGDRSVQCSPASPRPATGRTPQADRLPLAALTSGRQALLVLAHLRCGDTYASLAAGFGIGVATAYRYVREAVEILAELAPSLAHAVRAASRLVFVILVQAVLVLHHVTARGGKGLRG